MNFSFWRNVFFLRIVQVKLRCLSMYCPLNFSRLPKPLYTTPLHSTGQTQSPFPPPLLRNCIIHNKKSTEYGITNISFSNNRAAGVSNSRSRQLCTRPKADIGAGPDGFDWLVGLQGHVSGRYFGAEICWVWKYVSEGM